jgi:hypothetical protein
MRPLGIAVIVLSFFSAAQARAQTPTRSPAAVLTITNVVLVTGRAPAFPMPAFLLRQSFGETLKQSGISMAQWLDACGKGTPACRSALEKLDAVFVDAQAVGPDAPTTFQPVEPGTYYVFHYVAARDASNNRAHVWDLKVDLKGGRNAVALSQQNADPVTTASPAR